MRFAFHTSLTQRIPRRGFIYRIDGNAYAFTSTLLDGYLKLYAHHLTDPAKSRQRPSYHITLLKAYALSDDGQGVFRNLRIRAKEGRDRFIEIANARARDRSTKDADTEGDLASTTEEQQDIGSTFMIVGCSPNQMMRRRPSRCGRPMLDWQFFIIHMTKMTQTTPRFR